MSGRHLAELRKAIEGARGSTREFFSEKLQPFINTLAALSLVEPQLLKLRPLLKALEGMRPRIRWDDTDVQGQYQGISRRTGLLIGHCQFGYSRTVFFDRDFDASCQKIDAIFQCFPNKKH